MYLIVGRHPDAITLLCEDDADIQLNLHDDDGYTPLMLAIIQVAISYYCSVI